MKIKSRIIPAKPRSKELLYRYRYGGGSSSTGGGVVSSPGINPPTYWELITEDSEGNLLEEPYILTKYSAVSQKELSAYGARAGLEEGNTGASYNRLDDWFTYDAEKAGWVLSAKLGKDLLDKNSVLSTELSDKYNELRDKDIELAIDLENKYYELKDKDGDKYYETAVNMPSKAWEISHNLNKYPSVTVINNDNQVVIGDVMYIDENNLTVSFSAEFTGKVICN